MHISDLSSSDVTKLTKILQLLPHEDPITYSNRTLSLTSSLPIHLRRPNRLSRLLLPSHTSSTALCPLHSKLHAPVTHGIFTLLALEVGIRLNSLIQYSQLLTATQTAHTTRLRALHALWLSPSTYAKSFLGAPATSSQWTYQPSGCEACILSRVSGSLPTLLDLRSALLSRTTRRFVRRYGEPALLSWIDGWLRHLRHALGVPRAEFEAQLDANDEEAKALKEVRKAIAKRRKDAYRSVGNAVESADSDSYGLSQSTVASAAAIGLCGRPYADFEPLDTLPATTGTRAAGSAERWGDDHAAELGVTDHYAALLSTPYLPNMNLPAASGSECYPRPSSAHAHPPHPYLHRPTPRPASSVYTADTAVNNALALSGESGSASNISLPHSSSSRADRGIASATSSTSRFTPARLSVEKERDGTNRLARGYRELLLETVGEVGSWEDESVVSSDGAVEDPDEMDVSFGEVRVGNPFVGMVDREERSRTGKLGLLVRGGDGDGVEDGDNASDSDSSTETVRPDDSISNVPALRPVRLELESRVRSSVIHEVYGGGKTSSSTPMPPPEPRSVFSKTDSNTSVVSVVSSRYGPQSSVRNGDAASMDTGVTRWSDLYQGQVTPQEEGDWYAAQGRERRGRDNGKGKTREGRK